MEAARHLSLFVRDGRRVFPLRRTDVRHEIRLVDLRWLPGQFLFDRELKTQGPKRYYVVEVDVQTVHSDLLDFVIFCNKME